MDSVGGFEVDWVDKQIWEKMEKDRGGVVGSNTKPDKEQVFQPDTEDMEEKGGGEFWWSVNYPTIIKIANLLG